MRRIGRPETRHRRRLRLDRRLRPSGRTTVSGRARRGIGIARIKRRGAIPVIGATRRSGVGNTRGSSTRSRTASRGNRRRGVRRCLAGGRLGIRRSGMRRHDRRDRRVHAAQAHAVGLAELSPGKLAARLVPIGKRRPAPRRIAHQRKGIRTTGDRIGNVHRRRRSHPGLVLIEKIAQLLGAHRRRSRRRRSHESQHHAAGATQAASARSRARREDAGATTTSKTFMPPTPALQPSAPAHAA